MNLFSNHSPVLQKPPLAAVSVAGFVRVEEDCAAELLGHPAVIDGECLRCTAEQVPSRLHYNSCQLLYSCYEVTFSFICGKCTMTFCRTECPAVNVKNPNQGRVPEDAGFLGHQLYVTPGGLVRLHSHAFLFNPNDCQSATAPNVRDKGERPSSKTPSCASAGAGLQTRCRRDRAL